MHLLIFTVVSCEKRAETALVELFRKNEPLHQHFGQPVIFAFKSVLEVSASQSVQISKLFDAVVF